MVYYDNTGSRIRRPLRRSGPSADDATARFIRQVAADHPRFTPDEVYAEISRSRHGQDITKQMVRAVLA